MMPACSRYEVEKRLRSHLGSYELTLTVKLNFHRES